MSEENTPAEITATDPKLVAEETAPELGDAGKKALSEERAARKAAEKSASEHAAKIAEHEAEISRLRRANAAVKGTDIEALRAELSGEFAAQLTAAEIKAEAKGRLRNVGDVARYPEFFADVKAGDEKAIADAVAKMIETHPYLAAEQAPEWGGDVGQGQRTSAKPEPATPEDRMKRAYESKRTAK